jgi:hypothetical protein
MKLLDFATDLAASNRFVKAAFGGFAGAGKSRTATEFVIGAYKALEYTKPILVIDNEKGSRFLIPLFRNAGLKVVVKDTTSLDDVLTAFELLRDGQVDFLFIDSLTKVWYRYVREYKQKNKRAFMELMDWGKLLPAWQESFSDTFVSAQGSVVFTGRGGFSYEKEEDVKDEATGKVKKGQFIKSGVKFKLASETSFEPDLNVWMEQQQEIGPDGLKVWREAQVMKDRSGEIDGKIFIQPTYADFEPFVKFLIDAPEGPVAGQTSSRNLAPGENYSTLRTDKTIVLEELQEEIVRLYPTHTTEDKKAKGDLIEKLFLTRSWTKVENLSLERLQEARNKLWIESRGHPYGDAPPPNLVHGEALPEEVLEEISTMERVEE